MEFGAHARALETVLGGRERRRGAKNGAQQDARWIDQAAIANHQKTGEFDTLKQVAAVAMGLRSRHRSRAALVAKSGRDEGGLG